MPNPILAKLKPIESADDTLLDSEKCAELIIKTRKQLNISQKTLSMEMGITQAYLCDLEKCHRRWSMALFMKAKTAMEALDAANG